MKLLFEIVEIFDAVVASSLFNVLVPLTLDLLILEKQGENAILFASCIMLCINTYVSNHSTNVYLNGKHFLVFFVALETVALCFYPLVAFDRESSKSLEAGIKYLIFGALSSALLLSPPSPSAPAPAALPLPPLPVPAVAILIVVIVVVARVAVQPIIHRRRARRTR